MSIEHLTPPAQPDDEITALHELYEQLAYKPAEVSDFGDPSSAKLHELLESHNDDVLAAARFLMDMMISGEIR